ncbi:hypothetical protein AYI69_g925 [Smittium culicis]|uniref:Retrotransposon gag domain-containing protein n=1 Tax=Smittium culicis TaxID=133412 RepID=A0A1R1YRN7_9FUNG|nr:hypothetical protein AYI69_g925 [Smittium culicis]
MSYTRYLRDRTAWVARCAAKSTFQHEMVIQPGPFKLKGPVTKPRELEILILNKAVDTEKKYTLETDENPMESKNAAVNSESGSALRKPLTTEWMDMTPENKILESARAVRDKAETNNSEFVLLAPAPFYGHWKDKATTWMQIFVRYVDSTKRPLLNEELLEYVGYQLEDRAKWWHRSVSHLYPDWEKYVESFIYEYHPFKNKKIAKEKLKEFKIYNGDLLENYANIVSIFKVLGTTDIDEQVDILLEKLNRQDRRETADLELHQRERRTSKMKTSRPWSAKQEGWSWRLQWSLEFGNKSKESRTRMLESRMLRYGDVEKNGEVKALQIDTNQKLQSGEYTGIGGLVKIDSRHLTWQLDTGAGFNVISEMLAKELGFVGDEEGSAVLVSANGTKNVSQSIKGVALEFSGLKVKTDFYIMATGSENILLIGLQTHQELKVTVDLQQKMIKI